MNLLPQMAPYAILVVVLVFLAFLYLQLATKFNIIDKPNERSSHTIPTIRGGGILFFFSMIIYFVVHDFQYPFFIIGLSLIALISFIDDLVTLGAKFRLVFQFVALSLLLFQAELFYPPYLIFSLLLIVSIGFINIYNFMDGINGITGLCSLAALVGFLFLNSRVSVVPNNFIMYPILAILVFGYFNFRKKARFFAGDVGSISIALVIAFLVVSFVKKMQSPLPLLFVAAYIVDGGLTILRRLFNKENILEPHRSHLYQRLVQKTHLSHLQVSCMFALVQLFMLGPVMLVHDKALLVQVITMLAIYVLLGIVYIAIYRKVNQRP